MFSVINFSRANCKNCYKCIRSCPVKAIRMKNEQAEIIEEMCIKCGTCLAVCPQNAKTVKNDVSKVKEMLNKNKDVVVSLAPSFAGAFLFEDYSQMVSALKKLGFSRVYQTSIGARLIAGKYLNYYNGRSRKHIITTACPTINFLIEKYHSNLVQYLLPVSSPMEAHAKYLKKIKGHEMVVFIGPCIAKKVEIQEGQSYVDAVLTFEELMDWFTENGIEPLQEPIHDIQIFCDDSNLYPIPGRSFETIKPLIKNPWRNYISIDGLEDCIEMLSALKSEELAPTWIEMNACRGSCTNGPGIGKTLTGRFKRQQAVENFVSKIKSLEKDKKKEIPLTENLDLDFSKQYLPNPIKINYPTESELKDILAKIGKSKPEHELNCGVCGYNSCREKAIAVFNGMAEPYMCMPYMKTRAESLSNLIIDSAPNAIIVVDLNMNIQEFNKTAEKMFDISSSDYCYKPLSLVFDDKDYRLVAETGKNILNKKVVLGELITLQNIYLLKGHNLIVGIITNITESEKIKEKNLEFRRKTIDTTQKVIENQMRVAQEIASVLGETTADTKVMLNRIKQLLLDEIPGDENEPQDRSLLGKH